MRPAPESRHLLDKLIRAIGRSETEAIDHPARETKRVGDAAPVIALREVAAHASAMQLRFDDVLRRHEIPVHRSGLAGLGATLVALRYLVVDRVVDAERSFRASLEGLRRGLDLVKLLRDVSRRQELFGVIRWCDDWLGARRTLVAGVEAQLGWFAQQQTTELMFSPALSHPADEDYTVEEFETSSPVETGDERPGLRDRP
jgi:hypothetical protein